MGQWEWTGWVLSEVLIGIVFIDIPYRGGVDEKESLVNNVVILKLLVKWFEGKTDIGTE